jgi:GTPase SAR1 family protein
MGNATSTDKNYSFGKLVTIENDQLIFNSLPTCSSNKQTFVISMIGCARVGKSTFINVFASYIFDENINIAKTSSLSEHCTIATHLN